MSHILHATFSAKALGKKSFIVNWLSYIWFNNKDINIMDWRDIAERLLVVKELIHTARLSASIIIIIPFLSNLAKINWNRHKGSTCIFREDSVSPGWSTCGSVSYLMAEMQPDILTEWSQLLMYQFPDLLVGHVAPIVRCPLLISAFLQPPDFHIMTQQPLIQFIT